MEKRLAGREHSAVLAPSQPAETARAGRGAGERIEEFSPVGRASEPFEPLSLMRPARGGRLGGWAQGGS